MDCGDQEQASVRQVYWPAPFYKWPTCFIPLSVYSHFAPLWSHSPAHSPSVSIAPRSLATPRILRFASLPAASSWFACSFLIADELMWLSRFVSGHCLLYVCLTSSCHYIFCLWLLPSPWYPVWQCPRSGNTEISFPAFSVPSSISVTDQVWFSWLPHLSFVSQVCASIFSFMASPFSYYPLSPIIMDHSLLFFVLKLTSKTLKAYTSFSFYFKHCV